MLCKCPAAELFLNPPLNFHLETGAYVVIWAVLEPTMWLVQASTLRSSCFSLPRSLEYRPQPPGPADLSLSSPSPLCVADYYSPAMLGLKTDQEVLAELVRMKLPAVAALMDGHGVLWTLLVSRWFICLFVDILPVEVSTLIGAQELGEPL